MGSVTACKLDRGCNNDGGEEDVKPFTSENQRLNPRAWRVYLVILITAEENERMLMLLNEAERKRTLRALCLKQSEK